MADKGRGNAQISQSHSGGNAPIIKQGQTEGTKYGMDPKLRGGVDKGKRK